jgi:hypothetical protein
MLLYIIFARRNLELCKKQRHCALLARNKSNGLLGANTTNAEAAKAFVRFLSAPTAAPVIKAHGMEPG